MIAKNLSWIFLFLILTSCQTPPTKTRETPERKFDNASGLMAPIKIAPDTIVVDARSAFEYSMAHVPKSVSLQWFDFTESEPESRGVLQQNLIGLARRLAIKGIAPNTHVVIAGRGLAGDAEEGRVAWTLAYLGIKNIQFTNLATLQPRFTNVVEEVSVRNVSAWTPEPIDSLIVTKDELRFVINNLGVHNSVSYNGRNSVSYRIIDVRSANDYLGREGFGAKKKVPNMEAINIPWKEFFDPSLRPRPELVKRLTDVGILPQNRIIVLDDSGVASGAATMALRALGFSNAGNYAGGLTELLSSYGVR